MCVVSVATMPVVLYRLVVWQVNYFVNSSNSYLELLQSRVDESEGSERHMTLTLLLFTLAEFTRIHGIVNTCTQRHAVK